MVLKRVRYTFQAASLVDADRVNISYGYEVGAVADLTALQDITTAFLAQAEIAQTGGTTLKAVYASGYIPIFAEMFEASGGPATAVVDLSGGTWVASGTGSGPTEVALVASDLITTPRGETPFGRRFFGPFAAAQTQTPRPSTSLINTIGGFEAGLFAALLGTYEQQVISLVLDKVPRPSPVGFQIDGKRVDNAWDTQRRRGNDPTTFTRFPSS